MEQLLLPDEKPRSEFRQKLEIFFRKVMQYCDHPSDIFADLAVRVENRIREREVKKVAQS